MQLLFEGQWYETGTMHYVHVSADVASPHSLLGLYVTPDHRTVLGIYMHEEIGVRVGRPDLDELRLYVHTTGSPHLWRAIELQTNPGPEQR